MKNIKIENRSILCLLILFLLIFISFLRICSLSLDKKYGAAALSQTSYKITVKQQRGTIFDTNMQPLTNNQREIIAVLSPEDGAIAEVRDYLLYESVASLAHRLSEGKPVLVKLSREVQGKYVKSIAVNNTAGNNIATHLLGYVDNSGHGVAGIEAAFDSVLYSDKTIDFIYEKSADGGVLTDSGVSVLMDETVELSGVKLTIDNRIQIAVEKAASSLHSGAVVVSEVGSGKIRALASFPDYDASNLAAYLESSDSPFINRAFCAYNVGSVFKPCVAAALLEDGNLGGEKCLCEGGLLVGGKYFACHKSEGHGETDLSFALAQSCNTFFYSSAQKLGYEKIYDMASSLGFGNRVIFAENLYTEAGNLPTTERVGDNAQTTANLAIGQGELMLSPIALLPLYEAIANGGVYHKPTLIEGIVENGKLRETSEIYPTKVMSRGTAGYLKESLMEVIKSGTGRSAEPKKCTAAAKTATAQTGWLREGKTVDHSWLCGFFPAENPKYVVVIISENTSGGGTPCGPLFSAVCDAVYSLNLS